MNINTLQLKSIYTQNFIIFVYLTQWSLAIVSRFQEKKVRKVRVCE